MKYFILLFYLSIFIFSLVKCSIFSNALNDEFVVNVDKLTRSLSNECIEEEKSSEYNSCVPKITIANYKQVCQQIKSEKCQKFYNDPDKSKYFPICSKNALYNEYLQPPVINYIRITLESRCFTDENDNLCPYTIYAITGTGINVINDNCKSEKCTDLLINMYKEISIDQAAAVYNISTIEDDLDYHGINVLNTMVSRLESNKCRSLHTYIIYSSAINIKSNYILLFLLTLLLLFFKQYISF